MSDFDVVSGKVGRCDHCLNRGVLYKKPVRAAIHFADLLIDRPPYTSEALRDIDVERWCAGCIEKEKAD